MSKGSLREKMPTTAAWIDQLREAFGKDDIDQQIRRGLRGEPVFFASENGHTVGTPSPQRVRVQWDARGRSYVVGGLPADEQDEQTTKYAERQRREQLKGAK